MNNPSSSGDQSQHNQIEIQMLVEGDKETATTTQTHSNHLNTSNNNNNKTSASGTSSAAGRRVNKNKRTSGTSSAGGGGGTGTGTGTGTGSGNRSSGTRSRSTRPRQHQEGQVQRDNSNRPIRTGYSYYNNGSSSGNNPGQSEHLDGHDDGQFEYYEEQEQGEQEQYNQVEEDDEIDQGQGSSSEEESNSEIEDLMSQIKMSGLDDPTKIVRVPASDGKTGDPREIAYTACKVIGNGSFGVVFQAKLVQGNLPGSTDDQIAIKKVLQDKRFKNRELQIMRMVTHPNVVNLNAFFYSNGEKAKKDEVYLNLVLEYVPETVYRASRHYAKMKQTMPMAYIKLYMYQLLRSLAYIHCLGICHRDIKPQNLLLNPHTGILKLCDFGSAKILVAGEPNVSYICSRYYRAPELIFGATNYTTNIDIWSTGCVMAELMLGQPLFPGESGIDQLVEIIKVLGTPTREQIKTMNPNYMEHKFPQIKPHPFNKVFKARTAPDAISLISKLLEYTPSARLTAVEAMCHPLFDELKLPDAKMQNGKDLPALFDFTREELSIRPDLNSKLVPQHAEEPLKARGIDVHNFEPIPAEQMRISLD